ncbi:FT-interacting protein 3 [Canna indica]|uniref:FT-interacting protein 3 n=1 Tax=Canna indica TaxID=4628 RepID=A0AAQ3JWJ1_9LILI|nr:FT-interacting protein 3 [Canna indica]
MVWRSLRVEEPHHHRLVHILFIMLVCFPELILPTMFLYMFLIGVWNYRFRPRYPPHMNTKISHVEAVHPDELDEEFDTYPTSRSPEIVRMRYDRLRSVGEVLLDEAPEVQAQDAVGAGEFLPSIVGENR